jgi:hypothetical protein
MFFRYSVLGDICAFARTATLPVGGGMRSDRLPFPPAGDQSCVPTNFPNRKRFFPISLAREELPVITADTAEVSEARAMKAYRYLTGKDDAAFCHRVTLALNNGWQLYGQPTLTFDQKRGEVICGQVITKEVEGKSYHPELDLSKL